MDEPLGLIRRTDETRDMNLNQLTIAYLNVQLKEAREAAEKWEASSIAWNRMWNEEHDERIRLEERLKSAERARDEFKRLWMEGEDGHQT